jgi:hypothetical protein
MRELMETRMFRLNWGNQHTAEVKSKAGDGGIVQANEFTMEERIAQVMGEITDGNWNIKASMPITASEYVTQLAPATKTAPAMATSYAAPFTDGVILLCQRSRLVDEEAYYQITAERQERQDRIQKERREAFLQNNPITEKRKLIGSKSFQFRGRDYPTREAAEAAQAMALDSV